MASPQLEKGFTRIENNILEALGRINLTAYQARLLFAVLRKTYGWQKEEDWISNSQLVLMTGIRKQHISRAMQELVKKNILYRNGFNIGLNKNFELWQGLRLPDEVTRSVTSSGNKSNPMRDNSNLVRLNSNLIRGTQKKLTKETITKDKEHKNRSELKSEIIETAKTSRHPTRMPPMSPEAEKWCKDIFKNHNKHWELIRVFILENNCLPPEFYT